MKAGITTVRTQSAQEEGMRGGNNKLAAGGAVTPSAVGNKPVTARPVGDGFAVATRGRERNSVEHSRGCFRRMPTCRGVSTIELGIYVALAGLILAAVIVAQQWLAGYAREHEEIGRDAKQLEWDKDKERAAEAQRRKDVAVAQSLLAEEKRRLAAEAVAEDVNARWEEARREARRNRTPMVACPQPTDAGRSRGGGAELAGAAPAAATAASDVAGAPAPEPRLTWEFVRLYDGAWTGADGQPVPGALAGSAATAVAGAASPHGVDELIDVHAENARRCSEDRRELGELIRKLEAARDAVDNLGSNR